MKKVFNPICFSLVTLLFFISCNTKPSLPRPDHIVIVMEENHGFDQIIGSPSAPYINKLAKEGALMTESHGLEHPSQPNYIGLFCGDLMGVNSSGCLYKKIRHYTTPNLGAALLSKGYTFAGYSETLPADSFLECDNGRSELTGGHLYARKHSPWVNWLGDEVNQLPYAVNKTMDDFPGDFNDLPTVSFVIPNMDNDMHNYTDSVDMIRRGDDWLKEHLEAYVEWAKDNNSLLVLTYDEDDFTPENHIATLFIGEMVKPGEYADSVNHYNVLRTVEEMYDLKKSGSHDREAITSIWK